jgi:chorismate mutase
MPFNHPRASEIDKLERALVSRRHEIREEVAELKAHTPEGLQAKARMVMTELAEEADPDSESCNHQYLAAVSLARDILGRAV